MSSSRDKITFDPSGDVLLLLELDDDQSYHDHLSSCGSGNITSPADEVELAADDGPADDGPADETTADETTADETVADETTADEALADDIAPHTGMDNEFSNDKVAGVPPTSTRKVEMLVSSKHLALASPVFAHMFQSRPRDNKASHDRELVTVPLLKDDLESWQTLLHIVHGQTRQVNRQVKRSQLLQIVILIDKYEFHEVAEVFTEMWFGSLRPEIPRSLHQDLASWIYICWGLGKSDEFKNLTRIAVLETNCGLRNQAARVPEWVFNKVNTHRWNILTNFLLTLSGFIELYISSDRQCRQNLNCDALALGKLMQGLKDAGLYPVPEPSTLKRSIQELFSTVREIELPSLCEKSTKKSQRKYTFPDDEKSLHLEEAIERSLSSIEESFRGLNIDETSKNDETRTQEDAPIGAVEEHNLRG